jgi:hypothetical protein
MISLTGEIDALSNSRFLSSSKSRGVQKIQPFNPFLLPEGC